MRNLVALAVALLSTAATAGCGGAGSSAPDAGTGSTDGSHDLTGDVSTPVDGADATGDCFPSCIANARIGCWRPKTGTCVYDTTLTSTNYCFSNGVMESIDTLGKVHTLKNTSGEVCFSMEDITPPASTSDNEVIFRDRMGRVVARGTHPPTLAIWTIKCDGQTYTVDESDPACQTVKFTECTLGMCH